MSQKICKHHYSIPHDYFKAIVKQLDEQLYSVINYCKIEYEKQILNILTLDRKFIT